MRPWIRAWLALSLLALAGLPARAAETWVDADPGPDRLAMRWKEGRLEAEREGTRPFLRLTTDGRGSPSLAATPRLVPALDARRRFVKLLLRVHGAQELGGLEVRLGSDGLEKDWFTLSPQLYADPDYNFLQDGEWTTLTLSFGGARSDGAPRRAAIDSLGIVVRDRGQGPVSVDFGGWALVDQPAQGVVSLTFDDGYDEHLAAARMMAARGWRGTFYVIPSVIGNAGFLSRAGLVELGRLGSDVAAHEDVPFTDLAPGALVPGLREIQRYLVENGFARGSAHLAYPLGKQEPRRVRPAVRGLYETARLAGSGPETLPPADPHLLRAVNVTDATKPEEVGALARRARENGEWLILMFHHLVDRTTQSTDYAMKDFGRVLDELAKSGIEVQPVTAVWSAWGPAGARGPAVPAAPPP